MEAGLLLRQNGDLREGMRALVLAGASPAECATLIEREAVYGL